MIRPKILVVDDDESIRLTMKVILEDEGYLVDMAVNGREAIKMTQKTNYNLALLDIRLPDIEGVELLKLIKDGLPRLRKIMVTGYPSVQNAVAALNKNADAYLIKPVNLDELLTVVKSQLKLQEEEKSFTEEKVAEFIETRVRELAVNSM
jgi:DNA-binding NtrC family response regulator